MRAKASKASPALAMVIANLEVSACGSFPSQQLSLSSLNFDGTAEQSFWYQVFWSAAGSHVLPTIFGDGSGAAVAVTVAIANPQYVSCQRNVFRKYLFIIYSCGRSRSYCAPCWAQKIDLTLLLAADLRGFVSTTCRFLAFVLYTTKSCQTRCILNINYIDSPSKTNNKYLKSKANALCNASC